MRSPPAPLRAAALLATASLLVAIGGCGGGNGGEESTAPRGGTKVSIEDFAYAPANLTVAKGTTVEFTNEDSTSHTATATDGGFDTDTIKGGKSGSVTLAQPGTYRYYCLFHPFMKGTLTVK